MTTVTVTDTVSLASHTTLQVGGPAEHFVTVRSEAELAAAVALATDSGWTVTVLGGGSNVLVADAGITGLVIKNEIITDVLTQDVADDVLCTIGAGMVFDDAVEYTVRNGLWGLENLSHIPGSVGATPIQNVGAYGVEVADCIASVRVFDRVTGGFSELANEACQFGYRDSLFKQAARDRYIVSAVTFKLSRTPKPVLSYRDLATTFPEGTTDQAAIRAAVIAIRANKFPDWKAVGTAGSFFKNPTVTQAQYDDLLESYPELPGWAVVDEKVKVPLGWILDKALGLKGGGSHTVGQYEGQALVLINKGGATAADIKAHATEVVEKVKTATGITIEWEVTPLGF